MAYEGCRFFRPSPQRLINYLSGLPPINLAAIEQQTITDYNIGCCPKHAFISSLTSPQVPHLGGGGGSDDPPEELVLALAKMIKAIYDNKSLPNGYIDKDVVTQYAHTFFNGVQKGFGSTLAKLDYDTPNFKMLAKLQADVWHFAGAKNYTQMREIANQLIGADGKLRSFAQFKDAVLAINDKYIKQHLKTEYNLAVSGATMAAKWVDIQAQKEDLPYLEFDAVLDTQTTELCASLNGTILPVDHPFWDTYYPPNHFNCRSTVRQLAYGTVTAPDKIPSADIPTMFQTNLGKRGLIYPKGSSFYVDLPKEVEQQTMGAMRKHLTEVAKNNLAGKTVAVEGIGKVSFNNTSIKEMINQPHADYVFKNQLVPIANLLLKNATLIKSLPSKKQDVKLFQYLKVKHLNKNIILVVKENFNGENILYSIVDKIKE